MQVELNQHHLWHIFTTQCVYINKKLFITNINSFKEGLTGLKTDM